MLKEMSWIYSVQSLLEKSSFTSENLNTEAQRPQGVLRFIFKKFSFFWNPCTFIRKLQKLNKMLYSREERNSTKWAHKELVGVTSLKGINSNQICWKDQAVCHLQCTKMYAVFFEIVFLQLVTKATCLLFCCAGSTRKISCAISVVRFDGAIWTAENKL